VIYLYKVSKITAVLLVFALLAPAGAAGASGYAEPAQGGISVSAPAAIAVDTATKQVIFDKNADEKRPAGTVTKTMSLLLFARALEKGDWTVDEEVQVSENAAKQGGASAFLDNGGKYKLGELLRAVCMISANDACMALAEKYAGTEEAFVQRMNECAAELGLKDVAFTNCTGLPEDSAPLSARDIAVIACELSTHSRILQYCDVWLYTFEHSGGRETELTNANRLIRSYEDCDGLQTGSSAKSGYCMAATARRASTRLVCVVMGNADSGERQKDATSLFEYGFANFTSLKAVRQGEIVERNVPVEGGVTPLTHVVSMQDLTVLVPKGTESALTKEVALDKALVAPLKAGEPLGTVQVRQGDNVLASAPVTVKEDIAESSLMYYIKAVLRDWIKLF
jgi:D-alanyl-D-alanine carboxypeptidase (penicillin-binding protein 5/6)